MAMPTVETLQALLPTVVAGIIGHVTIYHAESQYWAYCVRQGRLTIHEEAGLRRIARHRLEQYIARKLVQYAAPGTFTVPGEERNRGTY